MTKNLKDFNQSYSLQIKDLNDKFTKLISFFSKNEEIQLEKLRQETFQLISILKTKVSKYKNKIKCIKQENHIKNLELEIARSKVADPQTLNTLASSDKEKEKEKEKEKSRKTLDQSAMNLIKRELLKSKESIQNLRNKISMSISSKKNLKISKKSKDFANEAFQSTTTRHKKINFFKEDIEEDSLLLSDNNVAVRNLICLSKDFIKEINEICSNYEQNNPATRCLSQVAENFSKNIYAAEACANYVDPTNKLREELENCKKIGKMFENKLKYKIETISVLREKLKEISGQEQQIKKDFIQYTIYQKSAFSQIIDKVGSKTIEINTKLDKVKEFFKKKLKNNLEELKFVNGALDREDFFNIQVEVLEAKIKELENVNREQFEKIIALEDKNLVVRSKKKRSKTDAERLRDECKELNSQLKDYQATNGKYAELEKVLKLSSLQLKHLEFEKKILTEDKDELLSRINSLEIELIECQELCNNITQKSNQKIEEFVFLNLTSNNSLASLKLQLDSSLKTNEALKKEIEKLSESSQNLFENQEDFNDISPNPP